MKATHEFFNTDVPFETLLNPYLRLVFKLKITQESQRSADPLDIFVYFLKKALDRQNPLVSHE